MKKLLFTIFGLGLMVLNAQVKDKFHYDYPQFRIVTPAENNANSKRALGTGWFDYATAYNDFNGSGLTSSVYFIQPDTNLYTIFTAGEKVKTGFHIIGRVNDPRDEVYSNNPVRFSRHNTYTWDSIRFTQFYVRQADSMKDMFNNTIAIVDTVFIQYFLPAGLDFPSYTYNTDPSKVFYYSCPKRSTYNKSSRLNTSAFKTDTIFLTKDWADSVSLNGASTTFFGRNVSAPIGVTVPHSATNINANIVGHTILFKPMKRPNLGDTGIAYNGASWYNKYNMYGVRMFSKTGLTVDNSDQQAQNNAVISNFEVVYGQTVNIFTAYIPGTVFTNTFFEGTDYHLTSNTVSVNTIDANGNGIGNIYPNPSNSSNEVFIPVKLANQQTVTLTICDVTGKVVKIITNTFNEGDFDVAVSTSGMSQGMYTCTMEAGDFKATTKFILN